MSKKEATKSRYSTLITVYEYNYLRHLLEDGVYFLLLLISGRHLLEDGIFWRAAFIGINTVPIVINPALKNDSFIKLIFMPACIEDSYPTLIPLPRDL